MKEIMTKAMKEIMTKQVCQTKRKNVCPTSVKIKNKTMVLGKICEKSRGKNNVCFVMSSVSDHQLEGHLFFYVEGLYVLFSRLLSFPGVNKCIN